MKENEQKKRDVPVRSVIFGKDTFTNIQGNENIYEENSASVSSVNVFLVNSQEHKLSELNYLHSATDVTLCVRMQNEN